MTAVNEEAVRWLERHPDSPYAFCNIKVNRYQAFTMDDEEYETITATPVGNTMARSVAAIRPMIELRNDVDIHPGMHPPGHVGYAD